MWSRSSEQLEPTAVITTLFVITLQEVVPVNTKVTKRLCDRHTTKNAVIICLKTNFPSPDFVNEVRNTQGWRSKKLPILVKHHQWSNHLTIQPASQGASHQISHPQFSPATEVRLLSLPASQPATSGLRPKTTDMEFIQGPRTASDAHWTQWCWPNKRGKHGCRGSTVCWFPEIQQNSGTRFNSTTTAHENLIFNAMHALKERNLKKTKKNNVHIWRNSSIALA